MRAIWKLQDAKAKFSKVVEDALKIGPQYVTKQGENAVVIISTQKYEELISNKPNFKEFLLGCPTMEEDFEIERQKDYPRSIEL